MGTQVIYSSQIGLVLSLFDDYTKEKNNYETALKKMQDYIAYAEEINRQMNEKFSQNDTYNGNILKNKLMYEIYPTQENLIRAKDGAKTLMDAAFKKYNDEKAKLSASEQNVLSEVANAAAQASIAVSQAQAAQAQAQIADSSAKMSETDKKALIQKIVIYSIAGVALLTVIGLSIWAYRKYVKK